jgi:hypothetical protein
MPDRRRAPPTLRHHAGTAVDITEMPRRLLRRFNGAADIVVADDVAGTDDHGRKGYEDFSSGHFTQMLLICNF